MKILLIEDDSRLSELLRFALAGENIEVAPSLTLAIQLLNKEHFRLALVDLNLPDSSGLKTLEALRCYKLPKIVITADILISPQSVIEAGAVDYIQKATNFDEFIGRIKFNIAKYSHRRHIFHIDAFKQIQACIEAQKLAIHS